MNKLKRFLDKKIPNRVSNGNFGQGNISIEDLGLFFWDSLFNPEFVKIKIKGSVN